MTDAAATGPTVDLATAGGAHGSVSPEELDAVVARVLEGLDVDLAGSRVTLVVPDGTRSCPLPLLVGVLHRHLHPRVGSLTAVIALGTHAYMTPAEVDRLFGVGGPGQPADLAAGYPGLRVVNHEWRDPEALVEVGRIPAERIAELSEGRLRREAPIVLNRHVVDCDVAIVVGPVFPHEVVGMSGGNKYFIPGVASQEFIDMTHWVGALITATEIIGTTGTTPVRAMIDEGAALLPALRLGLCCVVESGTGSLEAAAFGRTEEAWRAAADVAARTHVRYVDAPLRTVLALVPERYTDIWTAAKGSYKTEPAVGDGGEVVIYAPHITEVARMHPEIHQVGYHCRDYFTGQWERFAHLPWGVLAHSTHLRGQGTYDPATGEERLRIRVTLATGIPEATCHALGLGYRDPATIDPEQWGRREDVTVIPNAGEVLYRLRQDAPAPTRSTP